MKERDRQALHQLLPTGILAQLTKSPRVESIAEALTLALLLKKLEVGQREESIKKKKKELIPRLEALSQCLFSS